MQDLLIPGQTCLVFDRESHDSLDDDKAAIEQCLQEIVYNLGRLNNQHVANALTNSARERLKSIMWSSSRESDVSSFREFMRANF